MRWFIIEKIAYPLAEGLLRASYITGWKLGRIWKKD